MKGGQTMTTLLWMQTGACSGETMALLCADRPNLESLLRQYAIDLLWHPSLSAGTGAGKGRGQVIPALLSWPGSMIVTDPKGELAAVTARYRRELGQKVVVLAPFSSRATDGLNPLDSLNAGNPYRVEDAMSLARQMTPRERLTDPFWEDRAQLVLTATLLFIATHLPEPMRRLDMLRRIWRGRGGCASACTGTSRTACARTGGAARTCARTRA